jgi:hypothetical protein
MAHHLLFKVEGDGVGFPEPWLSAPGLRPRRRRLPTSSGPANWMSRLHAADRAVTARTAGWRRHRLRAGRPGVAVWYSRRPPGPCGTVCTDNAVTVPTVRCMS